MPLTSLNRRSVLIGAGAAVIAGAGGVLAGCSTTDDASSTTSASATGTASSGSSNGANESIFGTSTATPGPALVTVNADGLPTLTLSEYASASGAATVYTPSWDVDDDEDTPAVVYAATQSAYHQAVTEALKKQGTPEQPLILLNPYGTSTSGLLIAFATDGAGTLTATVTAPVTQDYEVTVRNLADDPTTAFLGHLVGLVPGVSCDVELRWKPESGSAVTAELTVTAPRTTVAYPTQVAADLGSSPATTRARLTDGLFVLSGIIGYGQATILVDNDGTQRGEIVTTADTAAQVPIPVAGRILTTVGPSAIGIIQPTGFLWRIIDLGQYTVHHDIHAVGDTAYVLVTDSSDGRTTVEDVVLVVDVPTGEIIRTIDMTKVLPDYLSTTHAREGQDTNDWLHLNSVDVVDDTVYLSSRETSTIIALDGATGAGTDTPTIRYLIGATNIWEGTGYEDKFLTKTSNFSENAGQHSLRRIDVVSLGDGQYYLEMFNNNLWYMGTRDDVEKMGPADASTSQTTGTSEILRYLVDENEGTVAEASRVDVPYSSVMGDALRIRSDEEHETEDNGGLTDHLVVCSAKARVYSERTSSGEVIAEYRADSPTGVYRVYKDSFTGYWYE